MADIQLKLNDKKQGAFYLYEEGKQIGEMAIDIKDNHLTVYHTEVIPEMEGKGLAKQLLLNMVDYARQNKMKVIALCPYVLAQFKRHEQDYIDIWEKQ